MGEQFVCDRNEIDEEHRKVVTINGRDVVVFAHGGKLYALSNVCLHRGGPVGFGNLMPKVEAELGEDMTYQREVFSETEMHIVCPWHGYEFDIDTGELATDRRRRLPTYEVYERDGKVYVRT